MGRNRNQNMPFMWSSLKRLGAEVFFVGFTLLSLFPGGSALTPCEQRNGFATKNSLRNISDSNIFWLWWKNHSEVLRPPSLWKLLSLKTLYCNPFLSIKSPELGFWWAVYWAGGGKPKCPLTFQQITGPKPSYQEQCKLIDLSHVSKGCSLMVSTKGILILFSHSYSSKKECQKLGRKATLDSFLGVCNPSFSLPRNTSLHFLLPSQCVCFMKTEAPHEEVAMENLFQVKNSHYGKVAWNLSADMQQLP